MQGTKSEGRRGADQLEAAKELLKKAKTVEELRAAQAIARPLMLGLSLEQTAMVIGRSVGGTCTMRVRFVRMLSGERKKATRSKRERRHRAKARLEREAQILDEALSEATTGGVVIVPPLKPAIEAQLSKTRALSTEYPMLAPPWVAQVGALALSRPRRRMFQGEARFGRISDVRHCGGQKTAQARGSCHGHATRHVRLWRGESC